MEFVRQAIGSAQLSGIFDLPPTLRDTKVEVINLPFENKLEKKPIYKVKSGFLKGKVPELPDSFFDPLPEEDLEAWEGKHSWGF